MEPQTAREKKLEQMRQAARDAQQLIDDIDAGKIRVEDAVWPDPTPEQKTIGRQLSESLQEADRRHRQHLEAISAEMKRLSAWVDQEANNIAPDWGDVGTVAEVHTKLLDLAQWLYNEGEYADTGKFGSPFAE